MDDDMDLYGDFEDNVERAEKHSEDGEKVESSEILDSDKHKVQNKASDQKEEGAANNEEMFDYLYGAQSNVEDTENIYDDILNPDANKTMVSRINMLEEKVKKSDEHMTALKSQISVLTKLNMTLREKNINCEKNLSSLKVTARTEINRKSEQIVSLRRELDNVLFRRSARNIDKKELDEILSKHKSSSCEGCLAKIIIPSKKKLIAKNPSLDRAVATSGSPNDVCVGNRQISAGNRQVPGKKRRRISMDTVPQKQAVPEKKAKVSNEGVKKSGDVRDEIVKKSGDYNKEVVKKVEEGKGSEARVVTPNVAGKVRQDEVKKCKELADKSKSSHKIGQMGQPKVGQVTAEVNVDLIKKYVVNKPRIKSKPPTPVTPANSIRKSTNASNSSNFSLDSAKPKLNSGNLQKSEKQISPDSSTVDKIDLPKPCLTKIKQPLLDESQTSETNKIAVHSSISPSFSESTNPKNAPVKSESSQISKLSSKQANLETALEKAQKIPLKTIAKSSEEVCSELPESSPTKSITWGSSELVEITPDLPIKQNPELVKTTFGDFSKGRSTPLIVKAPTDNFIPQSNENLKSRERKSSNDKSSEKCTSSSKSRSPERRPDQSKRSSDKTNSSNIGRTIEKVKSSAEKPRSRSHGRHPQNEQPVSLVKQPLNEKPASDNGKERSPVRQSHNEKPKSPERQSQNDKPIYREKESKNEKPNSLARQPRSPARQPSSPVRQPSSPERQPDSERPKSPERHLKNDQLRSRENQSKNEKPSSLVRRPEGEKQRYPGRQPHKEKSISTERPSKKEEKASSTERSLKAEKSRSPVRKSRSPERQSHCKKPRSPISQPFKEKARSPIRQPQNDNPRSKIETTSPTRQSTSTEKHSLCDEPKSPVRQPLKEGSSHNEKPSSPVRQPRSPVRKSYNEDQRSLMSRLQVKKPRSTSHTEKPSSPVRRPQNEKPRSSERLLQNEKQKSPERHPQRESKPRSTERPSHSEKPSSPVRHPQNEKPRSTERPQHKEKSPVSHPRKESKPQSTERPSVEEKSNSPVRHPQNEKPRSTERSSQNEKQKSPERRPQNEKPRFMEGLSLNEKPRSTERPSQNEKHRSPMRQPQIEKPGRQSCTEKEILPGSRENKLNPRERHASDASSEGNGDNLNTSRWWCDECDVTFLKREMLRQHRKDVKCKRGKKKLPPPRKESVDEEDVLQINANFSDFEDLSEDLGESCNAVKKQRQQISKIKAAESQDVKSNNDKIKLVETLKPSKKLDKLYVIPKAPKVSSTTTDHSDAANSPEIKPNIKKESRIGARDDHKKDRSRSRERGRSGERCKSGDRRTGRSRSREGRRRPSGRRSRSRRSSRQRSGDRGRRRAASRNRRSRSASRSRGKRRCRSRSQMRKKSVERLRLLSRRSQSLSPQRKSRRSPSLSPQRVSKRDERKNEKSKDLRKRQRDKKEDIKAEESSQSLDALEKMRNDVWAKLAAMESEEEGEVADSEEELESSKESVIQRSRKPSGGKLAKKLPNLETKVSLEEENIGKEIERKTDDQVAADRSSDKENAKERRKNKKDRRKRLGCLRDSSCSISADDLHDVTTEDLDNKLIPFKKRQFKELQAEAKLIQVKLEEARRSKSNTPVHSTDCYQIPIITESHFAGIGVGDNPIVTESHFAGIGMGDKYDSPRPSNHQNPPTVSQQNLPITASHENLLLSLENLPRVSPIKLSLAGVEVRAPSEKSTSCPLDNTDSASGDPGPVEITTSAVACEPDSTYEADDNATFQLQQQYTSNSDYKVLVQDLEVSESEPDSPFPERTPSYEASWKSPLKSMSMAPPKPLSPCRTLSPWRKPNTKSPQKTPLDLSSPSKSMGKINYPRRSTPMSGTHARPLDFTSPEGISNLLKSPLVTSNPIQPSGGASPSLSDNIRRLKKAVLENENNENALQEHSGNVKATKVNSKEAAKVSGPSAPVIYDESSRDSVGSNGSGKRKRRKLGRSVTNVN